MQPVRTTTPHGAPGAAGEVENTVDPAGLDPELEALERAAMRIRPSWDVGSEPEPAHEASAEGAYAEAASAVPEELPVAATPPSEAAPSGPSLAATLPGVAPSQPLPALAPLQTLGPVVVTSSSFPPPADQPPPKPARVEPVQEPATIIVNEPGVIVLDAPPEDLRPSQPTQPQFELEPPSHLAPPKPVQELLSAPATEDEPAGVPTGPIAEDDELIAPPLTSRRPLLWAAGGALLGCALLVFVMRSNVEQPSRRAAAAAPSESAAMALPAPAPAPGVAAAPEPAALAAPTPPAAETTAITPEAAAAAPEAAAALEPPAVRDRAEPHAAKASPRAARGHDQDDDAEDARVTRSSKRSRRAHAPRASSTRVAKGHPPATTTPPATRVSGVNGKKPKGAGFVSTNPY